MALNKLISIFVACTLLVFSTQLQELAKLPVLFQHYFEHQSLSQDITFSKYLWDHYNDVPHTDTDEDRDNQLPFKSTDHVSGFLSLAIPPSNPFPLKLLAPIFSMPSIKQPGVHIPSTAGGKIWQPPQQLVYS